MAPHSCWQRPRANLGECLDQLLKAHAEIWPGKSEERFGIAGPSEEKNSAKAVSQARMFGVHVTLSGSCKFALRLQNQLGGSLSLFR